MFIIMKKIILQKTNVKSSTVTSGFTLVELLAAVVIGGILVAGSTVGLTTILQGNADAKRETLARQNRSRALEFMAEEIKSASSIKRNPKDGILVLKIPDVTHPITYDIDNNPNLPWQGPNAIVRNGPSFNDGEYENPGKPKDWDNEILIDQITNEEEDQDFLNENCDADTSDSDTIIPNDAPNDPTGFYICLDADSNRVTEIFIRSHLTDPDGELIDRDNNGKNEEIRSGIRAFARSKSPSSGE